jgi:hypothetical protein
MEQELEDIKTQISNETTREQELSSECVKFAGNDDFEEYSRTRKVLVEVANQLRYLESKKQAIEWKLDASLKAKQQEAAQHRINTLTALIDSKKALRGRLDKSITTLCSIFKDIAKLHQRKLDELPDGKGEENTAFRPETYFHHFLLVLNSRPEASQFLDMADKVQYPSVDGPRKMKDYDYDLG